MSAGQGLVEDLDIGDTVQAVSYTGTQGRSTVLAPGLYSLLATTDCRVKRGGAAVAATATSFLLKANTYWFIRVKPAHTGNRDFVSTIRDAADGTIQIAKHNE